MAGWNRCERCDHEWEGRGQKKPVQCPKCKSPYWDKVRVKEQVGRGISEMITGRMKGEPVAKNTSRQDALQRVPGPEEVDEAKKPLCRACEGELRLVQGKMVCTDKACSMRGLAQ